MKKHVSILLLVIMSIVTALPCFAVQVIGQVLSTDIRAYINGAEIPAYNIDGKLAIVVSDLNNYGFRTSYNNDLRKSSVTRNTSATVFTSVPSKASGLPIGARVMDVYQSDITVELDGRIVQAFNVDNRMAIYFSELKTYGDYYYDNSTRASSINLTSLNIYQQQQIISGNIFDYTTSVNVTFPLHLFSNDMKTYLGKCVTDRWDSDGIYYEFFGDYSSEFSSTSIWNKVGTYGSSVSGESAFCDIAFNPPKIVDNNGQFIAYLTTNTMKTPGWTIAKLRLFLEENGQ